MICDRCKVESESLRAGECRLCESVSVVLSVIYHKWNPDEYEDLGKAIREKPVDWLIEDYEKKNAFLSLRVCRLIRHLGHSLPQGADYLKTRVSAALIKQHAHEEKCEEKRKEWGITKEQHIARIGQTIALSFKEAMP